MGVQILSKGVDAEDYAVEYAAPVTRGLEGIFFLNTSLDKCARNYAPGKKPAVVIGSPTPNSQYLSGDSSINYLQTDLVESLEMTVYIVARAMHMPSVPPYLPNDQPVYFGNYNTGPWSGVILWSGTVTSTSTNAGYGNDDASNTLLAAGVTPNDVTQWGLYAGRVKADGLDMKNFTNGLVSSRSNSGVGPRRVSDISKARKLRIGSGYQVTQIGKWDMATCFVYNVAHTDAEREIVAQDIRAYMARRSIIV